MKRVEGREDYREAHSDVLAQEDGDIEEGRRIFGCRRLGGIRSSPSKHGREF